MRRLLLALIALTLALPLTPAHANIRIASITDGDTVKLADGRSVRLLQIDTPELNGNECYAKEAQVALAKLLNTKGTLRLTTDPNLDKVDAYGRILRYIFKGKVNINLELVKIGAATPYFYKRALGRYSTELLKAAESARENKLGLWRACPGTKLDPYRALTTITQAPTTPTWQCDPNYKGCIPLFPPDLNCADIKKLGLAPIKVIGRDVHRLDADGDGIGCNT
ncbi:MAG: thermonuclease family protein [Actinomycetota bacterium]